jgi:predicted regulator of Ras-like GTPase activity (Roadblock/LC7/MglB family)
MENVLQGLLGLEGVNAALVIDSQGVILGQLGKAIYDPAFMEQVGGVLARVLDSVQLQHEDWESITAQFADGKLLARNVGQVPNAGSCVLVIIADATMNAPFATVAIRVAINKLKKGGEVPPPRGHPSATPQQPRTSTGSGQFAGPPPSVRAPLPIPPPPPSARPPPPSASSRPVPGGAGPDPAAIAMLNRCAKELARHLGPMARLFVEEAVRRVAPDQPFALPQTSALLEDLAAHIDDPQARAAFLSTMRQPKSQ